MKSLALFLLFLVCKAIGSAQNFDISETKSGASGYRIEKPGTITFTEGVKIKGKVEKPQVIILIPKEKPLLRKVKFEHSFKEELLEPLQFVPITE